MSHSIKYIRKEKGRTYSAYIGGPSPFGNGPFDNRWYFRSRGKRLWLNMDRDPNPIAEALGENAERITIHSKDQHPTVFFAADEVIEFFEREAEEIRKDQHRSQEAGFLKSFAQWLRWLSRQIERDYPFDTRLLRAEHLYALNVDPCPPGSWAVCNEDGDTLGWVHEIDIPNCPKYYGYIENSWSAMMGNELDAYAYADSRSDSLETCVNEVRAAAQPPRSRRIR